MGDDATGFVDKKKAHRDRHSGRKADKKNLKKKDQNASDLTDKQRNPKAFAFNSAIRAERRFRRKQDIETKKQHVPLVDRSPIEPPPILIAIVGPPKVGKSTLINNLIKLFTKSPLTDIKGPVTIVTGKKRRITLVECNNDINSMIDLAKVADLALLLCDASFGFEMEIFEFLNICQVHGMPRIMGILTHLDMIKNSKTLKNVKKTLKHRFWTEVYAGAKLFYLSGILHGEYLRNEIKNLGRFISVMKFRPLTWRTTHSYLLGDRYEDLTNQELVRRNPKCDRNISLYGYIRGVPLNKNVAVHIAGFGDVKIHDISHLPDPCPLPETIKKRALIEKEKFVYAPFSGVGGIVYDKDAVYVELGGSHSHHKRDENDESNNIVANLIDAKETLDMKMQHSELQLFTGGQKLTAENMMDEDDDTDDEEDDISSVTGTRKDTEYRQKNGDDLNLDEELEELRQNDLNSLKEEKVEDSGRIRRKVIFAENKSDSDDNSDAVVKEQIPEYIELKVNKDKDVHAKVSDVLKTLGTTKLTLDRASHAEGCDTSNEESDESESDVGRMKNDNEGESDEEDSSEENSKSDSDQKVKKGSMQYSTDSSDDSDDETAENDGEEKDKSEKSGVEDGGSASSSDEADESVRWKDNLAKKAEDAFLLRLHSNKNLMKLVYGVFDSKTLNQVTEENEETKEDEIGGLFKVVSHEQQRLKMEKDSMNLTESTLFMPWNSEVRDYLDPEHKILIENCFVTGKWKDSEDASELLKLDDAVLPSDSDSEVFGDFEDLETGEKFTGDGNDKEPKKRKREGAEKTDEIDRKALAEKKLKLKQKFDCEYDNAESATYYDELKTNAEKQSQLNKSVFESMPDDLRVQIEGYRPGMYVRIEFQNVPYEFINNFDPTYPIVIGALNMGEENIGYVNVRLKKHRWYKKILKANDPLIISLGWRRFQTLPLYSKLEDDLKFRYLKYTPQHLTCNAHFWGPITPQGTGFIALQSCEGDPEIIKQQGFRIAATGAVQELDKSTQIMKKLKLVGHPLKIYKKTAFVKGMFNSALEVAKFEGARIKTVSGIRGQIKKAASKPEGCFRATFEDKIQLSDIVFCRTWYKVDVQRFYNPITTLLLPLDQKNSWRGVRSTGEIKRQQGIRNKASKDSLYTEILREPKVFKPLAIPRKLQQSLPYRDKPKHNVKLSDKKKSIERVAVVKEPHEQKVSKMLKMIKTTYEHKQNLLKVQTKERLEKHKQMIDAQESSKAKKLRQQKKEVFRTKSKAEIREQKKGSKSKIK